MLEIKEKYGPEAMVFSSTHNLSQVQFENFLQAFGSPNYGTQRSLCFNAMIVSNLMTYGMEEPARDYSQLNYIILTGRNLAEAISNSETGDLIQAIDRGAKMVYSRPTLHEDRCQGGRVAAPPTRHRSGLPPGTAQRDYRRKDFTTRGSSTQYTVGFDELAASVSPNTRRMGRGHHGSSRRNDPPDRTRVRRRSTLCSGA